MKKTLRVYAMLTALALAACFCTSQCVAQAKSNVKITILGDSIDADQPTERPMQGWGKYLQEKLANATVTNLAQSGRSTKTYILGDLEKDGVTRTEAKGWTEAQATPADYWVIKFGGNDSHPATQDKHTDPPEYAKNLKTMIEAARKLGVKPILCTPFRRPFKHGVLTPELDEYAEAARKVAQEEKVLLIDVYAHATEWFTSLGPDGLPQYLPTDFGGHMNRAGAELMAEWMAEQLAKVVPSLELASKSSATK
jgi:lysophospholipase L1-like esterase